LHSLNLDSIYYLFNFFFLLNREQENDLERKYDLLNLELRAALSIEDWRKTEEQREREKILLAELVAIVDKRNELVLNLHSQEQA
jgi:Bivalent Mical/EHBP Rab binding domain